MPKNTFIVETNLDENSIRTLIAGADAAAKVTGQQGSWQMRLSVRGNVDNLASSDPNRLIEVIVEQFADDRLELGVADLIVEHAKVAAAYEARFGSLPYVELPEDLLNVRPAAQLTKVASSVPERTAAYQLAELVGNVAANDGDEAAQVELFADALRKFDAHIFGDPVMRAIATAEFVDTWVGYSDIYFDVAYTDDGSPYNFGWGPNRTVAQLADAALDAAA